jgi:hypothetical protein
MTSTDFAPYTGVTNGTAQADHAVVLDALKKIDVLDITTLKIGGTTVTSSVAQLNSEPVLVFRKNVTAAQVHAGATAIVPAVAGKQFQVINILMRANGGTVSGATTVGVKEDGGAIFLSQAAAGLTVAAGWLGTVTGTPVITGITAGGLTAVANKALLAYDAGGTTATATSLDFIVTGFYTS